MLTLIGRITSLLGGFGILLVGNGFLGTLLGVRAGLEAFPAPVLGAVMSAYFLGFLLGTLRGPGLIRRVGHIRAYAATAAVASIAAAGHGLMVNPWIWGLLRAAAGFCLATLYMTLESWLNAEAGNDRRGRLLAAYTIVNLLAGALGQYLILAADPRSPTPFTLAAMLLSLGLVPVALTRLPEPGAVSEIRLDLRRLHRVSPLAVAGALASGLANGALWGLGPLFAQRVGLSEFGIAAFMSAVILGGAALQWPIGRLSDRFDRRKVLVGACFAGVAAALGGLATAGAATPLVYCAFLYGGPAFALYSLSLAHANDHAAPEEVLETTRGLLLLYGLGAAAAPIAAGGLMGVWGPRSLFAYFAAVLALVGAYGLLRMIRRDSAPLDSQEVFVPLARTSHAALEMLPAAIAPGKESVEL